MSRRTSAVSFCARSFRWFDRLFFERPETSMSNWSDTSLAEKLRYLFVFLLIVAGMGFLFRRMPTAYLPDEDQGILMVQAMLPADSTLEQTEKVMDKVSNYFLEHEKDAVDPS